MIWVIFEPSRGAFGPYSTLAEAAFMVPRAFDNNNSKDYRVVKEIDGQQR